MQLKYFFNVTYIDFDSSEKMARVQVIEPAYERQISASCFYAENLEVFGCGKKCFNISHAILDLLGERALLSFDEIAPFDWD